MWAMMVTVFCRSGVVESREHSREILNANVVNSVRNLAENAAADAVRILALKVSITSN